ncbi:MAG: hypothetical protein F9B45_24740 [Phycisphaera sp. RhM]|nr:hypothetical protein [Phycisphaera sp. RhM]
MLKRTLIAVGLCVAVGSTVWALNQDGAQEHEDSGEKVVKLADTPAAVQSALKKAAVGATIDEIEMDTEDGVTIYEASWKVIGVEHEVSVDETGQVLESEQVVTGDAVPKAVRDAVAKHMPKGGEPEFEMKSVVLYSIEAMVDGKEVEILVDPAGRLMELEADDDHEHEEHDDDDDDGEDEEDDD